MYDSDRRQAANRRPILKSMSNYYVRDICTSDLCPFLKFSNRHPILKNLCFFFKFSNWCPILISMDISHFLKLMSLTYALTLTLTNKSTIDLKSDRYLK